MEGDWDVDKYRNVSEPKHHWELKKTFMESIKHKYPRQMVVMYAQTLGNIEFMGCRYPEDTMNQIQELAGDILDEFRERRGTRLQRTFVSGSAAANSKVNRLNPNYGKEAGKREGDQQGPSASKRVKYGNFVSASDSSETPQEKETDGFILPPLNNKTQPKRNGRIDVEQQRNFHMETDEPDRTARMEAQPERTVRMVNSDNDRFNSSLRVNIDNSGHAPHDTHGEPTYRKEEVEDFFQRAFKMPNYQSAQHWQPLRFNYEFPLHHFIVVTLAYMEEEAPTNILQRSASFCKMPVHWEYRANQECYVTISGHEISSELAGSKAESRDAACSRALEILHEYCYNLQIKSKFLSDGTEVDLIDVEDNTQVGGKKEALGSANVGHKLLSLMGWTGGGLGEGGKGISEPITAKSVFGREGLGSSVGVGKHFRQKIQKIIQEYMGSHSPYDLVFTTGFDNEQRKVMHEIARRHGLKSKSFGKGDDRHLTISRKFDVASLLEDISRRGGETEKYVLLPPRNMQ